jgi:PD-(D/E)XK endonuclease
MTASEDGSSSELTTNQKGAIAETAIAHGATKLGIDVYRPYSEGGRYDLIFDLGSQLLRVQCKWAVRSGNVVSVRLDSCRRGPGGLLLRRSYSANEIDAIVGYCAELDQSYFLPSAFIAGKRQIYLRLAPARNNQALRINWADQYRLGAIAQLGERQSGTLEVVGSSPTSST